MKDSVRTVWVSPDRVQVLVIMPWCPFLVVNVRHQLSGALINPACLPEEYCHCQHNAKHPVLSLTARSRNLWVPRKIHPRAQHPPRSPEPLLFDPRRLVRRGGVEQQVASPSHWLLSRSQPPQSSPGSKRADRTLQPHRHPHFVCRVLRPMLPDPALYPDGCYVPPQRRVPERSSDHGLDHANGLHALDHMACQEPSEPAQDPQGQVASARQASAGDSLQPQSHHCVTRFENRQCPPHRSLDQQGRSPPPDPHPRAAALKTALERPG
eukprot:3168135-Rhodomonas_salina.1